MNGTGVGLGSTLFFVLAAAALLSARVESAAVALLGSDHPAGRVARRLLPLAIGGPLLVGLFAIVGVRSGWIDLAEAISLLVTLAMAGFVDIVWLGSDGIRRAKQALDVAFRAHSRLMRANAAREQAERSRDHYLKLLRDLDAIVWEADLASGRLTFVSPAVREMLGDSPERLLASGEVWSQLPHPRDRDRIAAAIRAADNEHRDCDFEFQTVTADGRVRWLQSRLYAGQGNGGPHWQRGVMFDITERKAHEQRLGIQYETARDPRRVSNPACRAAASAGGARLDARLASRGGMDARPRSRRASLRRRLASVRQRRIRVLRGEPRPDACPGRGISRPRVGGRSIAVDRRRRGGRGAVPDRRRRAGGAPCRDRGADPCA